MYQELRSTTTINESKSKNEAFLGKHPFPLLLFAWYILKNVEENLKAMLN